MARAACLHPGARALGAPTFIKLPHDAAVTRQAQFCGRRRVYCPDRFFPAFPLTLTHRALCSL
ncbi:protein of unknown function [Paraburkholderia dioscoreae]|uniref:Uncharacterized protein n=1 Tax=Paraburkholderia dioscoreae TaxID=2604047 RepID=A0A5Q4ZC24_9BURK|nr:protein of unknown function [Paraburkholderia dioscoreae]